MLTLDKVYKASHVLKEVLRPTQCIRALKIDPEAEVYLKTENLQVTGSFKVRGAYFKISQLSEEELLDQGIKPNTIRLSIGTEHIDDIIADLEKGFAALG